VLRVFVTDSQQAGGRRYDAPLGARLCDILCRFGPLTPR
jgi:hypothetical protein